MAVEQVHSSILGLDIGSITTSVSLFGVFNGKFQLQNIGTDLTSLGAGQVLSAGVIGAIQDLQKQADRVLLSPNPQRHVEVDQVRQSVDQISLAASFGPDIDAVLLGLTSHGSLFAGESLIRSLPMRLAGSFGLADLQDNFGVLDQLIHLHPKIMILTGGENMGAEASIQQWVEMVRLYCALVSSSLKPRLFYAGNPSLQNLVQRHLEPVGGLQILPNLQPAFGELDIVPAQAAVEQSIIQAWQGMIPGFSDLVNAAGKSVRTKAFLQDRMIRYLSKAKQAQGGDRPQRGVLAVDLGARRSVISAAISSQTGTVVQPTSMEVSDLTQTPTVSLVRQWTAASVSLSDVHQYLATQILMPARIPETFNDLAISQAEARVRLQGLVKELSFHHPWFSQHASSGIPGLFEPIILSGRVLTHAPSPGQAMLMMLDGFQPRGISTIVLDRHHLLPLLGLLGEVAPLLPVHLLASDVFTNLGSVICLDSPAPNGNLLLSLKVQAESIKPYSFEIFKGDLIRLVIPVGDSVILECSPEENTDIGLGGPGIGGQIKVTSGLMGVVIDARGRPIDLPEDDAMRVDKLQGWLRDLGGLDVIDSRGDV